MAFGRMFCQFSSLSKAYTAVGTNLFSKSGIVLRKNIVVGGSECSDLMVIFFMNGEWSITAMCKVVD